MKGGYQIIDLKKKNLTVDGDAVKIDGVYEALEGNFHRATMIANMVIDNIERPNRWVNFGIEGTTYHASIGLNTSSMILYITVDENDMVSLSEM